VRAIKTSGREADPRGVLARLRLVHVIAVAAVVLPLGWLVGREEHAGARPTGYAAEVKAVCAAAYKKLRTYQGGGYFHVVAYLSGQKRGGLLPIDPPPSNRVAHGRLVAGEARLREDAIATISRLGPSPETAASVAEFKRLRAAQAALEREYSSIGAPGCSV
jgi:hypothetical protein